MIIDKVEIAKKKSKVLEIRINNIKVSKVIKNSLGNFFSNFHGFFIDK